MFRAWTETRKSEQLSFLYHCHKKPTWIKNMKQNCNEHMLQRKYTPSTSLQNRLQCCVEECAWFVKSCTCGDTRTWETANTIPGGAGSQAEAHVSFSRQRIISQLFQILGSEVFVCIACHCILTCQYKSQAGIRATRMADVCALSKS